MSLNDFLRYYLKKSQTLSKILKNQKHNLTCISSIFLLLNLNTRIVCENIFIGYRFGKIKCIYYLLLLFLEKEEEIILGFEK